VEGPIGNPHAYFRSDTAGRKETDRVGPTTCPQTPQPAKWLESAPRVRDMVVRNNNDLLVVDARGPNLIFVRMVIVVLEIFLRKRR
jgi:hypothetical protein